jgi:hypothetical protein
LSVVWFSWTMITTRATVGISLQTLSARPARDVGFSLSRGAGRDARVTFFSSRAS